MLTWALVLFAVAAVGGVVMIVLRARGGMPPLALALLHGLAAAAALVLLALAVVGGATGTLATASLMLFVLAALGGFALIALHLRTGSFPVGGALAHGATAVVAFLLLLAAFVG